MLARLLVIMLVASARLSAFTPYVADEETLHLWHLDESRPPFADSGMSPKPLLGLLNEAEAGLESLSGMGKAVSFNHSAGGSNKYLRGGLLLAQPLAVSGPQDNVTPPFPIAGNNGAFTIEAIIKFDLLPVDAPGMALDIVSMDGEGQDRVFNFRIEKPGFLSFIPCSGDLVRGGGLATIPTTGTQAINAGDWFHVAVTYDGNEGSPNNLKFYWTRLAPGVTTASLLGKGTLAADLNASMGDFAIGNTGRSLGGKRECDPFPGLIDEVRISSKVRRPEEFFFVQSHVPFGEGNPQGGGGLPPEEFQIVLQRVLVDGLATGLAENGSLLEIGPGSHRIDVDFGLAAGAIADTPEVRCYLEGIDDLWRPAARGMLLICEVLDDQGLVVSRASFANIGQSLGWEGDLTDSGLTPRLEPLFLPGNAKSLRITLSSGTPDITGQVVIDNLSVNLSSDPEPEGSLWPNGEFELGSLLNTTGGVPKGWRRSGEDPAIAHLVQRPLNKAIGLVDGNQSTSAEWTAVASLPSIPANGCAVLLSWQEAYNVIGANSHRATYLNVPPGSYKFRAIAVTRRPLTASAHFELPIVIRPTLWDTPWFRPVAASAAVGLLALVIMQTFRRRALARISKAKLQHSLERDRARIARDMHDDLGTRVSSLIMGTSLVQRDLDRDPAATHGHLARMRSSARDLANAMSELVWAVDPANDTLDQLASHLTGLAQEIFRDSEIRVRITIPTQLPAKPLRSDLRHHFSLAVKEALHNVFKHAGPCDVMFELRLNDGELAAIIRDTGVGFDPAMPVEGNGLLNLQSRLEELGGSYHVDSAPGGGTTVTLRCSVENLLNPNSR